MALTDAGAIAVASLVIADAGVTAFNNANAYLGVGDSSTAFAKAQTDLQAASNKLRKAMDATYPTRTGGVITAKSTFGTSDANFVWSEWAFFNASTAGTMFCRKVAALGTKASGATWILTTTITVSA